MENKRKKLNKQSYFY